MRDDIVNWENDLKSFNVSRRFVFLEENVSEDLLASFLNFEYVAVQTRCIRHAGMQCGAEMLHTFSWYGEQSEIQ